MPFSTSPVRRTVRAMKVRATIRSDETRELEGEGATYDEARAAAEAAVPAGWSIIALRTDRPA